MQQILVYSDSLAWGIVPNTRDRLPFDERWPGVLENGLNAGQRRARVIEDCLNGRRTVFDDPFKPGRNGLHGLAQRIEVNSPLALVILALGTNDFQYNHPYNNSWAAAQGIATLVNAIRQAPIEPGMPVAPILILCPLIIKVPKGALAPKFFGAQTRCDGIVDAYREVSVLLGCHFFDTNSVTETSSVDGIHLDANQHHILGTALVPVVQPLI